MQDESLEQETQKQIWQNKRMQKIIAILLLSLTSTVYALPNCPSDTSARWHNCFGTLTFPSGEKYVGEWRRDKRHGQGTNTFAEGSKYVGEWKDGKRHGQGTYTYANGTKENGYFMNDEYVPDICEDMGLKQGTSEFGQCVLKLIETIVE